MRLLKFNNHVDSFSLTDFTGLEIPSYAILSHTWGADGEEVTFEDLQDAIDKSKAGYESSGSAQNKPLATDYNISG